MHVVRDPLRATDLPRGGIATIGNFDGVHLGHRRILETVVARARVVDRPSVALTFEPHPLSVLRPDQAPRRLQTLQQKEEAIEALGVENLLVIPFTRDFSLTEPEEFVAIGSCVNASRSRRCSWEATSPSGAASAGTSTLLHRMGPECGFVASGVEEVLHEGEPSHRRRSAPRSRRATSRARTRCSAASTRWTGSWPEGDRVGRKIGYPTINLYPGTRCTPRTASTRRRSDIRSFGRLFDCVTNVGRRPTLYEDYATTIETYVLDFCVGRLRREGPALLPRAPPRGAQVPLRRPL